MEKMQKRSKPVTLLISLLGSWIVTAVLLVLLAAAMMKFQLEEGKISDPPFWAEGSQAEGRRTKNTCGGCSQECVILQCFFF